jgi:hypothetical protein
MTRIEIVKMPVLIALLIRVPPHCFARSSHGDRSFSEGGVKEQAAQEKVCFVVETVSRGTVRKVRFENRAATLW